MYAAGWQGAVRRGCYVPALALSPASAGDTFFDFLSELIHAEHNPHRRRLLIDPQGRTLLVRKRGTGAFMQPGGKIDAGETPVQALVRELNEELGLHIDPAQALHLGQFSAPAANEPGFEVQAELFRVDSAAAVVPAAEIEEVVWLAADQAPVMPLAPLTRDLILPLYRQALNAPR